MILMGHWMPGTCCASSREQQQQSWVQNSKMLSTLSLLQILQIPWRHHYNKVTGCNKVTQADQSLFLEVLRLCWQALCTSSSACREFNRLRLKLSSLATSRLSLRTVLMRAAFSLLSLWACSSTVLVYRRQCKHHNTCNDGRAWPHVDTCTLYWPQMRSQWWACEPLFFHSSHLHRCWRASWCKVWQYLWKGFFEKAFYRFALRSCVSHAWAYESAPPLPLRTQMLQDDTMLAICSVWWSRLIQTHACAQCQ